MNVVPTTFSRVSMQQSSMLLLGNLQSEQSQLLQVQQQISTGNALSQASDDPVAAMGIMKLNQEIAGSTQYSTNLGAAQGYLNQASSSLSDVSTLINRAQTIASTDVGTTGSTSQRTADASVVDSLLTQAFSLANQQYQGMSVFGGQAGSQAAFAAVNGGYAYQGTQNGQSIVSPTGQSMSYTLNGSAVFGGQAAQVMGYQDLTPALTGNTKLSDLRGATNLGVTPGQITLTSGTQSVTVDLSGAATVNDVTTAIQNGLTSIGSTASVGVTGNHLSFTGDPTNDVTVADASGSQMAAELGLPTTIAAGTVTAGASTSPKVRLTTPLSALNNGAGVDPTGFTISNGTQSATIKMTGVTTVQDLLNEINASGTSVQASINAAGTGINVTNTLSGSAMEIGEIGGHTADQLGIRSLTGSTTLASLNNGTGISTSTGASATGTLVITKTDGTTFNVSVNGIKTPSQLIAAINHATGNTTVTAALNPTGNGITLNDSSGGTGNLTVTAGSDYQSNGSVLGILKAGSGSTLTGDNISLSSDDFRISRRDGTSFTVNVSKLQTVQDVINAINSADGNSGSANPVVAQLNPTGNGIMLNDPSTGSGKLAVTALNSSTAAGDLGLAQTATASNPGVINGSDVNPIEPASLFSSLLALRNALASNDTAGINRAAAMLTNDTQRATQQQAVVDSRLQAIQSNLDQNTTDQTQFKASLSLLADVDVTTAITRFQSLETAYQASLKVAGMDNHYSLMDFLQ